MRNGDGVWREICLRDAVLAGDAGAWETWYAETYAGLEAYVQWRCARLHDLVEDVIQETWLTAVRSIGRFRPESGPFQAWVRGIAANVISNQLRKRSRQQRLQQPISGEPECRNGAGFAALHERSERIAQALAALPEQYEAVLRSKYLELQTVEQIAALRNETSKAVESLLTRARAAFRERFAGQE
jgi:RNA polymerase sigma-70 factor (ECF subfamily)